MKLTYLPAALLSFACIAAVSCEKRDKPVDEEQQTVFENKSVTPALVKTMPGFSGVGIYTLITGDDTLPQSPAFIFGAQPDGAGLIDDPASDGFILINNHEILRSVSRVYLDKNFNPLKGEYIVDAEGGMWRLCSASMATIKEHGFGPVFLTAGESGADSRVHAINPLGAIADKKSQDRVLPALGRANMENAVPLAKDAFPGKTVIIIGEDDANGQVVLYVSNTVGDLTGGQSYFLRRADGNPVETDMAIGSTYDVEFVAIDNAATATGAEVIAQSVAKNAVQFARVEDLDYRKGGGAASREIYFAATGVANQTGKTMWGRVYKLILDAADPLKGKLTPVADGAKAPGNDLINPDNICATENFVYIQEDGDSFYPDAKHDSYVWQYNIATGEYKPFITMHHRREDALFNSAAEVGGYNQSGRNNTFGSWEYGAMYDVSDEAGEAGTFLLNIHPHTWQKERFLNADGTTVTNNKEGGQVVILRGVPQ